MIPYRVNKDGVLWHKMAASDGEEEYGDGTRLPSSLRAITHISVLPRAAQVQLNKTNLTKSHHITIAYANQSPASYLENERRAQPLLAHLSFTIHPARRMRGPAKFILVYLVCIFALLDYGYWHTKKTPTKNSWGKMRNTEKGPQKNVGKIK